MMENNRSRLANARRIVIKIGTSTITYENGRIHLNRMDRLARIIADLSNQGREVVIVSSGAIGAGMSKLNMHERPRDTVGKQAAAAVGQTELMYLYSRLFSDYGYAVGQILLSGDTFHWKTSKKNVQNTFEALLSKHIIPIVNENDSVSTEEIEAGADDIFNENDKLSALVAINIKADLLIILSDMDGFFDCDPKTNGDARLIHTVDKITSGVEAFAGGAGSSLGTGGMATKLDAAKLATASGVDMVLANGDDPNNIIKIIDGETIGTLFCKSGDVK